LESEDKCPERNVLLRVTYRTCLAGNPTANFHVLLQRHVKDLTAWESKG